MKGIHKNFAADLEIDTEATNVTWVFEPFVRPRKNHPGEAAYLSAFQNAMGGRVQVIDEYFLREEGGRFPFHTMMRDVGEIREEDPRLVASFMLWLGTNVGGGYMHKAQSMHRNSSYLSPEECYLAAWTLDNLKSRHRVSYQRDHLMNGVAATFNRVATLRDSSVLDIAAYWLGSGDGQDFLKDAEKRRTRFEKRLKQERQRQGKDFF